MESLHFRFDVLQKFHAIQEVSLKHRDDNLSTCQTQKHHMSTMESQITGDLTVLQQFFGQNNTKRNMKALVLCCGNLPVVPLTKGRYCGSTSLPWRHNDIIIHRVSVFYYDKIALKLASYKFAINHPVWNFCSMIEYSTDKIKCVIDYSEVI